MRKLKNKVIIVIIEISLILGGFLPFTMEYIIYFIVKNYGIYFLIDNFLHIKNSVSLIFMLIFYLYLYILFRAEEIGIRWIFPGIGLLIYIIIMFFILLYYL